MNKKRILIIDDNRVLRESISAMLNNQADMHVVGAIGGDNGFLLKAISQKPQVILMDVGLKDSEELSVVETIMKKMPDAKMIGIGSVPLQSDIVRFVEAGASGFILKEATTKEFIGSIRSVMQGQKVLPPSLTGSLFSHMIDFALNEHKEKKSAAVRMTIREREIIALIAESLSNKEIALRLNIATHTVKSHVHNIMEKLALHTRMQISKFIHEENP